MLMKKLHFISFLLTALAFYGCTNEEPFISSVENEVMPKSNRGNPYRISINDAIKYSDRLLADIDNINTRSPRKVESVKAVTVMTSTRSSECINDTILYIINYEDDEGFAIVSADKRAIPVYAISETGHFEINKNSNPAIEKMVGYAHESAKYHIQKQGVNTTCPDSLPPIDTFEYQGLTPYKKIAPMLSLRQNRLGITPDIYKYVINKNGEPAKTCCAPIAVELIMSYHKWPYELEGWKFNWDTMNSGFNDDGIARIISILSGPGYTTVYGNTLSDIGYSYVSSLLPTFKKCGYFEPDPFINFYENENTAISHLENGPLLITASSNEPNANGHTWVIDGLLQYLIGDGTVVPSHNGVPINVVTLYTYYHCVWGDEGRCNGYYLFADHDFNDAPDFFDEMDSGDISTVSWRKFSKNIKFSGNFKPKGVIINPSK